MKIVNFSHPLTNNQVQQIQEISGQDIDEIIEVGSTIDPQLPLAPQIEAMLESTGLSGDEWQTLPLLVNLPALNFSSAVMLAQLHGLMGHFPTVLRLRPVENAIPPRFELAEILNLQATREDARNKR